MKQAVFLVLMLVTIITAEQRSAATVVKQIEDDIAACQASESPTPADVESFNNNQTPASTAGKCFVGCMFERMGFIVSGAYSRTAADAHANLNMSHNKTLLTLVLKANLMCEPELKADTDKCVSGPKLMQCLVKNIPYQPPKK